MFDSDGIDMNKTKVHDGDGDENLRLHTLDTSSISAIVISSAEN